MSNKCFRLAADSRIMAGTARAMVLVLAIALIALSAPGADAQETVTLAPTGAYAAIDTSLATRVIQDLTQPGTAREQAVRDVTVAPQNYAPPVFYQLSSVLFDEGHRDDAAFWFYAGQLRARFDANRCTDPTAAAAVSALNEQFGTPINQYMFQDPDRLAALVEKVVDWDRATPHDYDQRWINLHGMAAVTGAMDGEAADAPLSLPEDQWDMIAERTRTDYLDGLRQALEMMN